MADFGQVVGHEIKADQEGNLRRFLQVAIDSPEDVQSIEQFNQSGIDSSPSLGSTVLIDDSGTRKVAYAVDDGIVPVGLPGETHLYSSLLGARAASIILRTAGILELNGVADFAVRFSALQGGLSGMAAALNVELGKIATEINGLGGSYTPAPITIDLSTARVDQVKLP